VLGVEAVTKIVTKEDVSARHVTPTLQFWLATIIGIEYFFSKLINSGVAIVRVEVIFRYTILPISDMLLLSWFKAELKGLNN
jgi:hypothetical protein